LYHETKTGFRIESKTGLANRLHSYSAASVKVSPMKSLAKDPA